MDLGTAAWPAQRLPEALRELARRIGAEPQAGDFGAPAATAGAVLEQWLVWAGSRLSIEVEAVASRHSDLTDALLRAAPALLRAEVQGRPAFFLLVGRRGRSLSVAAPDGRTLSIPVAALAAAMTAGREGRAVREVDRLLDRVAAPPSRRARARAAMLDQRIGDSGVTGMWTVRSTIGSPLRDHLRDLAAGWRMAAVVGLYAAVFGLELLGWLLIGSAILGGRLDIGWLVAWFLLMITMIPARLAGEWVAGGLAIDAARLLKARLLAGALRLDPQIVRREGAGQFLGRVIEAQAFETVIIGGGLAAVVGILELGLAGWILQAGAGGGGHMLLLVLWLSVTASLALRSWRTQRRWTESRLAMTGDLVERMVGHRTALAQEQPARRGRGDDRTAAGYLAASIDLDGASARLLALMPGAWLPVGIAGLVPSFVSGSATTAGLAVGIGGILYAQRALTAMTGGFDALARAAIAWGVAGPLYRAATAAGDPGTVAPSERPRRSEPGRRLLDVDGVTFSHPSRPQPILEEASLTIDSGDRVILEGASGSGKSTLAGLIAGLHQPGSGLILLDGLDRATLGDGWRRLATEAPQYHENHILAGSLAFNLLMGRAWPPSADDLVEAEAVCRELGLGDLLAAMPAGLMQPIGETAWQLSQGEKSRVFLARALLQGAALTVLDETFAALDPENLERCLDVVDRRADAVIVIAHP